MCDEPTSGLDSTLSVIVVEILREVAQSGITVITTIHSPSSAIFDKFDTLIVLDKGEVFYQGKAKDLVPFLKDTLELQVPEYFNPADFLMDVLVLEEWEQVKDRVKAQRDASLSVSSLEDTSLMKRETGDGEEIKTYVLPFHRQVFMLLWRMWRKTGKTMFSREQVWSYVGLITIASLLFFQMNGLETSVFPRSALVLWLCGTSMYLGYAFFCIIPCAAINSGE